MIAQCMDTGDILSQNSLRLETSGKTKRVIDIVYKCQISQYMKIWREKII